MMKTLSLHMQTNNGVSTNMGIVYVVPVQNKAGIPGADPGFQARRGALKQFAPIGGRRENCWGISCEKSRFYAKKSYFFQFSWIRPCIRYPHRI
jgi:hypothetical protein